MPGLTQSFNVTGAPTQVFTTTVGSNFPATNTVQVFNSGSSPIYIGQKAVSQSTGMQLNPGAHFRIVNMYAPLYAVAGAAAGATSTTVTTSMLPGITTFTVGSTSNFAVGSTILVGNAGNGQESLVVTGTTATIATVSTSTQFSHVSGETVTTATVTGGQIQVIPGVV